jgi:ferric-dicitrate binding protein FerR (iron transport regulator)
MAESNTRLIELYDRYIAETATVEELREFWTLVKAMPDDHPLHEHAFELYNKIEEDVSIDVDWSRATEKIFATAKVYPMPVHRVHFLKRAWWKYAAAVLLLFGVGTYLYINNQKEKPSVTQTNPVPVQNDVAPGGNRATLTLADGRKIELDNAQKGQIAKEENATINKTADGKIVYDPNEKLGNKILFNTMSTPRGGQYQLTLADGSQVWLNAESSITYPTAFTGQTREVTITGEAYFEVAKNKFKPFIVAARNQTIEVLGTHFNVNAYTDENIIRTTLIEGSVRLIASERSAQHAQPASAATNAVLTLKPGQQGQYNPRTNNLSLAVHPDVEQVMAWKNGRFKFGEGMDITAVLRQVSRWYDVDIQYEGKVSGTIGGSMSRQVNASKVLDLLKSTGSFNYRIEGQRVIISPPK